MRNNLAARLGVWSAHHRRAAILGWLLLVVLATVIGGSSGLRQMSDSERGAGDSARAQKILDDAGLGTPAGELVMVSGHTAGGWRQAAKDLGGALQRTGLVQNVQPPLPSAAGTDALVRFELKGDANTAGDRVRPVLDAVRDTGRAHGEVRLYEFGRASADHELSGLLGDDFKKAEFTAVPLALGILLVVFGAAVAALLPVVLAFTACMAAFGLLTLASHQLHLFQTTYSVMFLMGLAVGVDYCLFYLRRERDERAAGHDADTALRIAAATSGRAVLVSGITVMVAMAGMFFSGLMLFEGFAVATIIVVCIAMLGSVTVLPALLAWLGDRTDAGRIPFLGRRRGRAARESGALAGAVLRPVLARPKLFAGAALAALLVLAAPALGMKTQELGLQQQFGSDAPLSVAYQKISATFPDGPAPALVVAKGDLSAASTKTAIDELKRRAPGARVTLHPARNIAEIEVPMADSKQALAELREHTVPQTLGRAPGVRAYVGGELAGSVDFNDQLKSGIVPVFLFIAAVTFLLMLLCFRSYVIALTSIALNLLSVGATYGVMTAVFQHGWGAGLIGSERVGAIESWLPLFVLVVLFGLSMDYHVFVVSRIREAHESGLATRAAIGEGIRRTAGAVTGAAAIMVAVFAVFATLSMQDMQQMGVGLAVAVLLDATVVRMVLLPSVMALLGDRNWGAPRRTAGHRAAPRPQRADQGAYL
ncbi:MMPL family transporter [Streptomyces sp. NPDC052811]|uniref:MMPL family transporter n=1 Tax=Streptomyces sp. NPDC052811 TaxID=3155731 RepID=UPI0034168FB2